MRWFAVLWPVLIVALLVGVAGLGSAFGDGDIHKVDHVIVIMQGGHSFDNYFGALAYVPGGPYHNGNGTCGTNDHSCVDGLTCGPDGLGGINCTNQNANIDGTTAFAFHSGLRCVVPALDPSWFHTHLEINFLHPNRVSVPLNDGFLLANTLIGHAGSGLENPTPNGAMAFYNQNDLPFYYDLAQKFAIEDRYFASVAGPSFPNRSYLLAATSFGHLSSNDALPPPGGYKPITGTIFDLLNLNGISWANYYQDGPQGSSFLPFSQTWVDPHFLPLDTFMAQAAGSAGAGDLPQVSFVDPNFGLAGQTSENDERPPTDIQRGQAFVSQAVSAVRNGPYWQDSVIFLIYDEHGGFYDHAFPIARQLHSDDDESCEANLS
jgi:phospholipase C